MNPEHPHPGHPPPTPVANAPDPRLRRVRRRLELGVYETGAVRDELAWRLARVLRDIPVEDL